jgi:hypothetical protein
MTTGNAATSRLEGHLASLLLYGTWLASGAIGLGLLLELAGWQVGPHDLTPITGMEVVTAGIACFIMLPVLRVALMLIVFVRDRDYRFGAIAAIVLAIILVGFALGVYLASPGVG